MDFTKEALQELLSLAEPNLQEIHGQPYSAKKYELIKPPLAAAFEVTTLDGFVNMLEAGIDSATVEDTVVHVVDYQSVQLVRRGDDSFGRRVVHLEAKPLRGILEFTFNQYQAHENFMIALQSLFQTTPDLTELLDIAAHVSDKMELKTSDNGVAQSLTLQRSTAFREETTVKPRVQLKPYCTFRELDQPERDFIFRVKEGGQLGLFEADGGAWKIRTVDQIANWLKNRIHTSEQAGLSALPIIS